MRSDITFHAPVSVRDVCDYEYFDALLSFRPSPYLESAASAVRAPAVVSSGWATLPMFDLLVIASVAFSLGYWWGVA